MEMNGINYFTVNSRHINIRYLFIKDQVERGGVFIVYFPTHLILDDYFTKMLQVALFCNFRDIIMGRVSPYIFQEYMVSYSSKERIGKQIILK